MLNEYVFKYFTIEEQYHQTLRKRKRKEKKDKRNETNIFSPTLLVNGNEK